MAHLGIPDGWVAALDLVREHREGCWIDEASVRLACPDVDLLVASGWLERWTGLVGGPHVTLTPWAAVRLGVVLVEVGADCVPIWRPATEVDPHRPIVAARHERERSLPFPDRVEDHRAAADRERVEVLLDQWSGEPVRLWGQEIPVDRRMRAG